MDHPVIERVMRTGYPNNDYRKEIFCEHCSDELLDHVEYDGVKFCGSDCLGRYLINSGDAKRISA